ncbi:MAG: hypothetical protein ACKO7Z_04210 [Cyanobacteriota bacterium]
MQNESALQLTTLEGCGLAIGRYPRFRYDGRGGGGLGRLGPATADGLRPLRFDPVGVLIPPLCSRTTRFLGLPLPPGVRIAIQPEQLAGNLHPASGELRLRFCSRFRFSIGTYTAPDLLIDCELQSEAVQGRRHGASGMPLDAAGEALLVGVAVVQPCGEAWLDRFLGLPDEALALLRCRLTPA